LWAEKTNAPQPRSVMSQREQESEKLKSWKSSKTPGSTARI
jgi:hypothetical protein